MPRSSEPLTIALDASLWDEPTTGIGLYTRCLAGALESQGVRVLKLGARSSGEHPRREQSRTMFALGRLPALLAEVDAPLFHAVCNFNLPLMRVSGKRMVLTVHDLIPEVLPEAVSRAYRWQFRLWLSRSLQVADRVVCDSEHTRQDLISRLGVAEEKAVAVHLGVDHVASVPKVDSAGEAFLRAQALPKEFVLYAGALDARKNVDLVLDALERLRVRQRLATLVLAGQSWFGAGPVEKRIAEMRADGFDIRPLGYQSSAVFYELMRRAAVFVFPSKYEGFGLPPLEAMASGTATIVSKAGSLPEVCGDAAVQVDPSDADGLATAIDRLLSSPAERAERGARGKRWAAAFTWERTARETIEVYRSML